MSSWLFGGGGGEAKEENGSAIIKRLSARIESATLLDDRRDSVRAIKALSRKYRREVTEIAMGNLIELIKTEGDTECLSSALEAVCCLVCADEDDFLEGDIPIAKETSIQLAKSNHLLVMFLDCFDNSELKVKWSAVKLLTALAREYPVELQQVIQDRPTGVSSLVDCVSCQFELLRNATLLLLIAVADNNPILQKIIVFQNGFEIVLNVAISEGGIDNSPVAEDCLSLLLVLLENNQSNVTFFCETALIPKLIKFIATLDANTNNWPEGKVQCGLLYLRIIRSLVSPSLPINVSTPSRKVVRNCSLLSLLLKLIMGSGIPETILTEIIVTVAECIRGYKDSQTDFQILEAPLNPPRPAMVVLLMSMVNSKQPLSLRLAVLYCTASWLHNNPAAQSELVDTLLPSDIHSSSGGVTAGHLLCGALFSPDATTSWLAATALSHSVLNQKENQEKLVRVQLAPGPNQPPTSLSAQLDLMLSQSSSPHTRLGILQFLSCWCADSSYACQVLLQEGKLVATLQLLIDGSPSDLLTVLIHGVACFLLGLLAINDESDQVVTHVRKRPGPDAFLDKMAQVGKAASYQLAAGNACPSATDPSELQIFNAFTSIYRKHEAAIGRHVAQYEDVRAEIAEKREKEERIKKLEGELANKAELQDRVVELENEISSLQIKCEQNCASEISSMLENVSDINVEEIKTKLETKMAADIRKELEEKLMEEVKSSLKEELKAQLEEDVLIGLEEELRKKIGQEFSEQKSVLGVKTAESNAEVEQTTDSTLKGHEDEQIVNIIQNNQNIDVAQLTQERIALEQARVTLEQEKTTFEQQKTALAHEKEALNSETEALHSEKAAFKEEKIAHENENIKLHEEEDRFGKEKKYFEEQQIGLSSELRKLMDSTTEIETQKSVLNEVRNKLDSEQNILEDEKEQMNTEKIQLNTEKEQFINEKEQFKTEKEQLNTVKEQFINEKEQFISEKEQFQTEKEKFNEERTKIEKEGVQNVKIKPDADLIPASVMFGNVSTGSDIDVEDLKSRITELELENANLKDIIRELEAEIEAEKNNVIEQAEKLKLNESVHQNYTKNVEELKSELSELKNEMIQSNNNSDHVVSQKDFDIHDLESQLFALKTLVEDKDKEISSLKFGLENKAFEQVPALSSELINDNFVLKAEFEELKKDQDDLLELLSDQQIKIGEYREKMKQHAIPVSDEEDLMM